LVALNDEIAALVRAGVPLERGLGKLAQDMPGRLGKTTQALAERMQRGQSLAQAVEEEGKVFPPVYRAVVLAGLRAGSLAAALQSVSRSARRLADTRRMVAAGFFYPLLVVLVASGLLEFFLVRIAPVLLKFLSDFEGPGSQLLVDVARWAVWAAYWAPALPILVVLLAAVWWLGSSRAALVGPRWAAAFLGWLPWLGSMLRSHRIATFAEVLALLVENRVPLDEGLLLAAEAAGDRRMLRVAGEMAAALRRGQPLGQRAGPNGAFPPMLGWLMATGQSRGALGPALRHAADNYQRRARRKADVARVFLPVLLAAVLGGTTVLLYALLLFVPWIGMLNALVGV
jgi:general secretion pathway protein F